MKNFFEQITFLKSVMHISDLPKDNGIEIAFAGRSNAGKSSALNAITSINNLAKTSKTPGRTQTINLFEITPTQRLVDLPGYGFAKVPLEMKKKWEKTLEHYLETRECLKGLCLIMDIRHPLQPLDQQIIDWSRLAELPLHILLTKADKLSRQQSIQTLYSVKKKLEHSDLVSCELFSSMTNIGISEARKKLLSWFKENK